MRILIAGSSGLVGTALSERLIGEGHEVYTLHRTASTEKGKSSDNSRQIQWDPTTGIIEKEKLENFDAFINLAGENIARRWDAERKKLILESRVSSTNLLCSTAAGLKNPPKTLINASAIGYYGSQRDSILDEKSQLGTGFLAEVCQQWEKATSPATQAGIRTVLLRIGIVLSTKGGILKKLLPPFKWGLGGYIGTGKQYMSWIALEDLVNVIVFVLHKNDLQGPINAVAPEPVTNREFTRILGKKLSRPTFLPLSERIVHLIFGQMGDELMLASTRVAPQKLESAGYQFLYPDLMLALQQILKKPKQKKEY